MNRRELLKAVLPVAGVSLIVKDEAEAKIFEVSPEKKYLIVCDAQVVNTEWLSQLTCFPAGTNILPLYLDRDRFQTIDDAFHIYEMK